MTLQMGVNSFIPPAGVAIPDSEDLHYHYDISESSSLTFSGGDVVGIDDLVGDTELTGGSPTLLESEQNGLDVARFNASGDVLTGAFSSTFTQPNHVFMAFRDYDTSAGSSTRFYIGTDDGNNRQDFGTPADGSEWRVETSSGISGGSTDTNWHIASILFNGSNSHLRLDGVEIISGNAGSHDYNSVALGGLDWNNSNWSALDFGEAVHYPQDKTSIESDVEGYLADKWGVTI